MRRTLRHASPATLALAGVVGLCLVLDFVWLAQFRNGFITGWDESGYLATALNDRHALMTGGPWSLMWEYEHQQLEAPLVPALSVPITSVFGSGVLQGLYLLPILAAALTVATYALARRLMAGGWALLAAGFVATLPVVWDYSRQFHFAMPAALFLTAALWTLLRSDALTRTRWVYAFGVCCGLLVLARTMTVAYLPGLAVAALAQLAATPYERRRRLLHLGGAAAAGLFVAASWYLRNWQPVWAYLTSTGYGPDATDSTAPVASWSFWSKELRLVVSELYLPAAAVLAACFVTALATRSLRVGRSASGFVVDALRRPAAVLVIVVVEGYLVLTTSANAGTAFALPWLPALVVLAVLAASRVSVRPLRTVLAAALVAVCVANTLMKSGWVAPLAHPRSVAVPALGRQPVLDGNGPDKTPVADAGFRVPAPDDRLAPIDQRWLPFSRRITGWMIAYAKARGQFPNVTVAENHQLFNQTWIALANSLWFHRDLIVVWIGLPRPPDRGYRTILGGRPANFVLTSQAGPEAPTFDPVWIDAAARSLGYRLVKTFRMPDGRLVWDWWRRSPADDV